MPDPSITLAAVAGAHGVSGEVRLKLFGEGAESLARFREVEVGGRPLTLVRVKANGLARFAEITDRGAAEALRGSLVTVARAALPPLDEGEYYYADLIGLACVDQNGQPIGIVIAVENFGAGDILEIETPDRKRTMVPFRAGIADLAGGRILLDPAFLT